MVNESRDDLNSDYIVLVADDIVLVNKSRDDMNARNFRDGRWL